MGDLHGDFTPLYSIRPETYLCLLTGDFCVLNYRGEEKQIILKNLEELPIEIAYINGNHDAPTPFKFPLTLWNGGLVHRIAINLVMLLPGEIYYILNKKVFSFGGGYSIDRAYRELGRDYWPQEMPSPD